MLIEVTTLGGGIASIIKISQSVATTEGRKERKRFRISASDPQGERRDTRIRAPKQNTVLLFVIQDSSIKKQE